MSLKSKVEKMPGYNSLVKPVHYLQAVRAGRKYHWPARGLRVIAVTGTNGKTTTSFMIWKMLNEAGRKAGVLSTVGWGGVGGGNEDGNGNENENEDENESRDLNDSKEGKSAASLDATKLHSQIEHMTTESVRILNQRMRAIADAGAEFLVLETTSHALSQSRILGVPVEIAVFTNLTPEHLDYHKTFANYRRAKLKLFKQSKYGVVNADDENGHYFSDIYASGDIITYGIKLGDLRATDIKLESTGVKYVCSDMRDAAQGLQDGVQSQGARAKAQTQELQTEPQHLQIKTQIPGEFNVYNSLAAVGVGLRLGLSAQQIERGIYSLTAVEGRMTRVRAGQEFEVIVDYAHQPDALQKVFDSVKPGMRESSVEKDGTTGASGVAERSGRIITVHGGAGRRDHGTRAPRGEILGRESDIVIITEDDSRDEDPAEIAQMFVAGAEQAGKAQDKDLFVELDRREAIKRALSMAQKGDLVLILGKGHEKTILRADGPHEFEDIKVVEELLRSEG